MRNARFVILFVVGVALLLIAGSCGQPEPEVIEKPVTVVVPKKETVVVKETVIAPAPEPPTPEGPTLVVPFEALWAGSGHADVEAEAFAHWDEDDPPEVPVACAKCHSEGGYLDFLGLDGTAAGAVDNAAPIGTSVTCVTCHNEATAVMDSVVFPSGVEITGLGDESRCMQCHQGRASKLSVDGKIEAAGVADLDTVSEDISFTNIHYHAAAATRAGGDAMGGYQYEGKTYDATFTHVEGYATCASCHDPHTLQVKVQECSACHAEADPKDYRMDGSLVDYDGDGDTNEGISYEVEGLRDLLYQAMQAYGTEVAGAAIGYDAHSYPYFFIDSNGNGVVDEDEAVRDNAFASWTARLSKAAYNYQVALKDPGGYAHGGKYIIQLLYDSIEDLNTVLSTPIDLAGTHRIDDGHFAGSEEAFRHWDEDGEVSSSCAKCHSAAGLPFFLKEGVDASQPLANGLDCASCHDDVSTFTRYEVGAVEFPSGASLDTGNSDSNICLNCHQGRASTLSVNASTAGMDDDTVSDTLSFQNVHYFAAGATLFGTDAKGAYEYDGKTYLGRFEHVTGYDSCTQCHTTHGLDVRLEACGTCHPGTDSDEALHEIRMSKADYDGDGDTDEGIAGELNTVHEALYEGMQAYATDVVGTGIVYDSHSYPYFFTDTNANGEADPDEANYGNRYATFTPSLLKAAYNYQYAAKDPGAYAHNGLYIIQVLYDTLEDIGGDVSGMTRP
jgi:hypothetical protein